MRLVHSDQDIVESFITWHKDPRRIARLYRWLVFMGMAPDDTAYFIENAEEWQLSYDDMQLWSPS